MDILELGIKPISQELPCGEDCKYDADYEALDSEMSKQTSIDQSLPTNWVKVNTLCMTILSQKSKSLNVGAYLFYSELKLKGLASLTSSCEFFYNLLNNFWECMYPPLKRVVGRKNIIDWWSDKLSEFAGQSACSYLSDDDSQKVIDYLTMIDSFIAEKLPDCTSLEPIIRDLTGKIVAPKEEVKPIAKTKEEQNDSQKENSQSLKIMIDDTKAPEVIIETTIKMVDEAFGMLLKNGYIHEAIFKISRMRAWGDITELPLHEKLQTYIAPPNTEIISIIEGLITKNDFNSAIWVIESRLCEMPLWLDLQKYSYDALTSLGYSSIAEVVKLETNLFISRLDGIVNFKFNDGTPLANSTTKLWLEDLTNNNNEPKEGCLIKINNLINEQKITDAICECKNILDNSLDMNLKIKIYDIALRILSDTKNYVIFEAFALGAIKDIEVTQALLWNEDDVGKIYETILNSESAINTSTFIDFHNLRLKYCRLSPLKALKMFPS